MDINIIQTFAENIRAQVIGEYGSKMQNRDLPPIIFKTLDEYNSELNNVRCDKSDNVLLLLLENNLALTAKDDYVLEFINQNGLGTKYPEGTIFIVNTGKENDDRYLSILCHELMHHFFKGFCNQNDEGRGYDEACTDHLARHFYGDGYYTSYELADDKFKYMKYYNSFFHSDDLSKKEKLDKYMSL